MVTSVAVIGVGSMGAPMARRLREAGYALTVCDRSSDSVEPFAASGVAVARTPSDCARCDLVLVLVATAEQMREVVTGDDGIIAGLPSGHSPVVVVMSTVAPDAIQELASDVEHRGVRLLDAPISGGPRRAEGGLLTIIVGGESGDLDVARPVLAVLGAHVFHCGPVGSAQTIKIVNNIVGVSNAFVAAEAYRIALDRGVDLSEVVPIVEVSSGRNQFSASAEDAAAFYAKSAHTRPAFDQLTSIMRKDLGLALEMVSGSDASYPVLRALVAMVEGLGDETFDNWRVVGGQG